MSKKLTFGLLTMFLILCLSGCCISHEWKEATCTVPKTCTKCNETEGDVLGHSWVEATCTTPKTCSVCSETEGNVLEHTWMEATCTVPKTCSLCGDTSGKTLEHSINYNNGKCRICEKTLITITEIEESEIEDYFNITYSGPSDSPCTITVEPKNKNYTYNGFIALDIYQGKKATYGSHTQYANTYRETVTIKLDKNGCGSVTVTFPDYKYYIRCAVTHSYVTFY